VVGEEWHRPDMFADPRGWDRDNHELALDYIWDQMMNNLNTDIFKDIQKTAGSKLTHLVALYAWAKMVCSGCPWDHKPLLKGYFALPPADQYTEVPGTDKDLYFDVWSNIHYGYLGAAAGFSDFELQLGPKMGGSAGTNDKADERSVQIGIDLWRRYGKNLTKDELDQAIRDNLAGWATDTNVHVKDAA
jgi:hypothetical protein